MPIPHLRQGTLDGLCGVYALLNAIFQRIYRNRDLTYKHQDEHFRTAMSCLPKSAILNVVTEGLTCEELLRLSRKFLKYYSFEVSGVRYAIKAEQPFKALRLTNRRAFHEQIQEIYSEQMTAAILGLSYRNRSANKVAELNKSGHWLAVRACRPGGFHVANNRPDEGFISKNEGLRVIGTYAVIDYDETIILRAVRVK